MSKIAESQLIRHISSALCASLLETSHIGILRKREYTHTCTNIYKKPIVVCNRCVSYKRSKRL